LKLASALDSLIPVETSFSFPSGHALGFFGSAWFLSIFLAIEVSKGLLLRFQDHSFAVGFAITAIGVSRLCWAAFDWCAPTFVAGYAVGFSLACESPHHFAGRHKLRKDGRIC
jgi:hypothetical protein